jgi:hypothetical protein
MLALKTATWPPDPMGRGKLKHCILQGPLIALIFVLHFKAGFFSFFVLMKLILSTVFRSKAFGRKRN